MELQRIKPNTILLLFAGLILLFALNIGLGSIAISFDVFVDTFFGKGDLNPSQSYIILNYRLPKAITAVIVGSGLGISGLLMQTLFKNPLAGPFVLGISSGASLGVAVIIMGATLLGGSLGIWLSSEWSLVLASTLGSCLVLLTIVIVANRIRDTMAILIIGLMFASITAAVVNILAYLSSAESLKRFIFWGFGSLGNMSWVQLTVLAIAYVMGLGIAILALKGLNALLLGERYAQSLGLNIRKHRLLVILSTSILAGGITAFAGPIAFIGLAIPHLTRQLVRLSDHRVLFPAVMLCGAMVMLICDSIAQLPFSERTIPINIITSLVGAPVVIWLLVRKRKFYF